MGETNLPSPHVAPKLIDLAPGPEDPPSQHACNHCARRFARRHWLAMHIAHEHEAAMTLSEAQLVGTAEAREGAYLTRLRKHVRASLFVAPWILFYFYGLILIQNAGANPALGAIPLPGFAAFLALIYFMVFTHGEGPRRGSVQPSR